MLHKVITKYNTADIYCMTLLPNGQTNAASLEQYNTAIRNVANHFNLSVVDLYNNSGITYTNKSSYLNSDNLHPIEAGMKKISEAFINVLKNNYVS